MVHRIRNIRSIQVFQAVYEAGNVTRASQELAISQSSVSYHIKKLEAGLGLPLFRRNALGLEPTEEGEILASHVERGLEEIRAGLDHIANHAGAARVALLPMFASRWLSSRLGKLLEANRDLQLSILNHNNTYARMTNPERFADLGIQWGRGNWSGFQVARLWPERLVVVCSPNYLRANPIRIPADLARCTLLHVDDTRMWDEWFSNKGLSISASGVQMMLEDRHFQLSSTINGLGVSLFASWAVQEEIRKGELVDPFGNDCETSFAYHLIIPRGRLSSRPARLFGDWLMEEAKHGPGLDPHPSERSVNP